MKMKIVVCGAAGRMGRTILELAKADQDIEIAGAVEFDASPFIGSGNPQIIGSSKLEKVLVSADVLIDFTNYESALKNLETARKCKKPTVIGTTGFSGGQKDTIAQNAKHIPILLSPNMSIGVNVLFDLVKLAARKLSDYDVEILEIHHNKKKDAPSGTALKLAEIVADNTDRNIDSAAVYQRHNLNQARTKEEIGIMSLRAGDSVGEHIVYFAGTGERIELVHRAYSRQTFAAGALKAAKWIIGKKPALYSMRDVLGLE
jgi:4-hydroxy-tetrahydrodipicolinate reductase